MVNDGRDWMYYPRRLPEFEAGVNEFLDASFAKSAIGGEIYCPCKKCRNRFWCGRKEVKDHLIGQGFVRNYYVWRFHGEVPPQKKGANTVTEDDTTMHDNMEELLHDRFRDTVEKTNNVHSGLNEEAKKFYRLVEEGKQELFPGCKTFSKLSFIIRLLLYKTLHGLSNVAFDDLLKLLKEAIPEVNIPANFTQAKSIVRDLGLDYEKIPACPNDCMPLYRRWETLTERRRKTDYDDTLWDWMPGDEDNVEKYAFENLYGKKQKKKDDSTCPWKKRSIFFELPYWQFNSCRHNLDVMHIEKNICDNLIGTLLDINGKTKDHAKARFDLLELGIKERLQPQLSHDSEHVIFQKACFSMSPKEKDIFCRALKEAKLPYGCASNIAQCVRTSERKVSGYKSHDAHILLHYLLQVAVVKSLPKHVAMPLIRLGDFFRNLCSKVIKPQELDRLELEITEILCELEKIFLPAFFDIMVHLPIHLVNEVRLGGPVQYRGMYFMERYLCKLKSYVRNKSRPEGSIAEGYLIEECLTFCSRYMHEGVKTKLNKGVEDFDSLARTNKSGGVVFVNSGHPFGGKKRRKGKVFTLDETLSEQAHRYALFNSDCTEIDEYIKMWEYVLEKYIVPGEAKSHVLQSIGALWRGHKSRLKKKHFYGFKDNSTRLKNRPKCIPEKDFLQLLRLWNSKQDQKRCLIAKKRRMSQKNMHTAGPKSFARIREDMKNEDPNKEPPSLTKMFERTRERKEGHVYADTYDETERLIEQMKNYNAAKEGGSGEDGGASVDPFLAVMNKEYNGHRRLFGRGVTNKLIKKVNGSETSYMVPGELMESVRTDIDAELNRLVEMRKQIEDDHERKKLEIAEEHKRNKAELEDMSKKIEDQHDKLVEDAVKKLIQKLPPRVVREFLT
ncbi:transposase, Ptta/En/Spm [Tanacetum coccineum]